MENIIKKAIEGRYLQGAKLIDFDARWSNKFIYERDGYTTTKEISETVLDPLFWQALGKACGWENTKRCVCGGNVIYSKIIGMKCSLCENARPQEDYIFYAVHFHEINLTEGWDKAVSYLQEVTK